MLKLANYNVIYSYNHYVLFTNSVKEKLLVKIDSEIKISLVLNKKMRNSLNEA